MSNKRKTEDISKAEEVEPINLRGENKGEKKRTNSNKLFSRKTPYSKIKDIYGAGKDQKSIFMAKKSGKHFTKVFIAAFIGFLILFAINSVSVYYKGMKLKTELNINAQEGYLKLLEASKSTTKINFTDAKVEFEKALDSFKDAEKKMWFIVSDDSLYANKSSISGSAKAIFDCGKSFVTAGEYFLGTLEELNKIPLYVVSKNEETIMKIEPEEDFSQVLEKGLDQASKALNEIASAREKMESIDQDILPNDIKNKLALVKDKIDQLMETLKDAEIQFPAILKLIGVEETHRYLVLLQNNAEIRPSGGFIGSYALVDVRNGLIESMKVEDVYDIDGKFKGNIESPEIIRDIMPGILFRNSNYSQDFYFSGKKAAEVLEIEGGPKVDTVIAINQSLLKDLLAITGPLQVGGLANKIDAENYEAILTYIIEGKIWGEEDPKHILKVMIPEFKKAIIKKENVPKIMSVLYKAVQQKLILAYSKDPVVESFFDTLGVSGRVQTLGEKEDYISVINTHTSVDANKTDLLIEEKITHISEIQEDGSVINELTIARTHTFNRDHQQRWNEIWDSFGFDHRTAPGFIVDILGRGENVVDTRIYVPEGSKLIEVLGADESTVKVKYDKDLNKTCFATNFSVAPQNTVTLTIRYKLPFKLDVSPIDTYKLIAQKQPGSVGSLFTKTLKLADPKFKTYASYPESAFTDNENKIIYAENLEYDRYFSAVVGK